MSKEAFVIDTEKAAKLVKELLKRYNGATFEMLQEALVPTRMPIKEIEKSTFRCIYPSDQVHLIPGKTGKVVSKECVNDNVQWREIVKGRISKLEKESILGELYMMHKESLKKGLEELQKDDFFEIDCFGVTSKLEGALTEAALASVAKQEGFTVKRIPENIAVHVKPHLMEFLEKCGLTNEAIKIIKKDDRAKGWPNFDFLIKKDGITRRLEVKSLWGTDTRKARLIHSVGGRWTTSSCQFEDQDIFAVNLWLRTGSINEFAFARSTFRDEKHPYGLPGATKTEKGKKVILKEYVHQNPACLNGDGSWFPKINDVWKLF